MLDANLYQDNLFNAKMMIKQLLLADGLPYAREQGLGERGRRNIHKLVWREMADIFCGRNPARNLDL